jgi:RNase P/RNase MRP subunit p30
MPRALNDEQPTQDGRTAPQLATDAEESVRAIVQLVQADDRALDVETIYRTLSGLTRMLDQVPEAVTRLRAAVQTQHAAGALTVPGPGDPDVVVAALTDAVDALLAGFGAVRTGLDNAQAAASRLQSAAAPAGDEGAGSAHG